MTDASSTLSGSPASVAQSVVPGTVSDGLRDNGKAYFRLENLNHPIAEAVHEDNIGMHVLREGQDEPLDALLLNLSRDVAEEEWAKRDLRNVAQLRRDAEKTVDGYRQHREREGGDFEHSERHV